jgi:hypothetical protein
MTLYVKGRKKLGLCYKCGEKFIPGHQCSNKKLNMIKGVDEEDEEFLEVKEGVIMRLWLLKIK